jgi:hypothetical protein
MTCRAHRALGPFAPTSARLLQPVYLWLIVVRPKRLRTAFFFGIRGWPRGG